MTTHVPVMLDEVLQALRPRSGGRYIDGTLGGAGHAVAILETSAPGGSLLGLDADRAALERARARLQPYADRVKLVQSNFRELHQVARTSGFTLVDGVLLDIGISSDQLASQERGFSFQADGPLDMRFDRSRGQTAADLLNQTAEEDLADIFFEYGEERRSRRLARMVTERRRARPFQNVSDLVTAVEAALGGRRGRINPATRAFQALRIAVNDELEALKTGLAAATELLVDGGRLVVISFHSLEDRIVKRFIQSHSAPSEQPSLRALTRKPLVPAEAERETNPRSRSAKLRAAERIRS